MEPYRATAIGFYPAAEDAATRKDNRMRPVKVDDGQLQILFEWCGFNLEPVHDAENNSVICGVPALIIIKRLSTIRCATLLAAGWASDAFSGFMQGAPAPSRGARPNASGSFFACPPLN